MTIIYYGSGGGVPRKTAKIFAENADIADVTEFGSTLAGETVTTDDIADIQNEAFQTGWRDAVISDQNFPLMGDMNAVQKTATQQIAYVLQHGVPEWNSATEYYTYDIVSKNAVLYVSVVDENTNHDVTDDDYWAVYYDPNDVKAKRNIGELVFSILPLTSTDLHLCDGSVLSNNGIYVEFCQYIATLYNSGEHDNVFCTEQEWQTSVTTYGTCAKFVYDSVNGTVRLPLLTGMVEGTLDVSALTDITEAGLPSVNHTHTFSGTTGEMSANETHDHTYSANGDYNGGVNPGAHLQVQPYIGTTSEANLAHTHDYSGTTSTNSSVSGIYGNSSTVQPQTVKGFYYIVVSNIIATSYTIQWDQVANDLAGKYDKTGGIITGDVTIQKNNPALWFRNNNMDYTSTTAPSTNQIGFNIACFDANNHPFGNVFTTFDTNNNFSTGMSVTRNISSTDKTGMFTVYVDTYGNDYAYASDGVKQTITNWPYPSNNITTITVGASGATYIAPADGYFSATNSTSNMGWVAIYNTNSGLYTTGAPRGGFSDGGVFMPVKKGDVITMSYYDDRGVVWGGTFIFVSAVGG